MEMRYTPAMHLKSEKQIEALFKTGKSISSFPLRARYLPINDPQTKAAFTVSKRLFNLAVDRNHIKRLLREAYRTQKNELNNSGTNFALLIIYVDKAPATYDRVAKAMKLILNQVV